jgi:hypothetical protein
MFGEGIESLVDGSEILSPFYGDAWPCFHDAEVVEVHLWRGYLYPGDWDDRKVLILEATQPGATGSGNDLLAPVWRWWLRNVPLLGPSDAHSHKRGSGRCCPNAYPSSQVSLRRASRTVGTVTP